MPATILSGLQQYQPNILFSGLPAIMDSAMPYMLLSAGLILLSGHVLEQKELRRHHHGHLEHGDLWIKTILVFAFMLTSSWWVAGGAIAGDTLGAQFKVGTPAEVASKCFVVALSMPEFNYDGEPGSPKASLTSPGEAVQDAMDGSAWGYVKGFFAALGETASWYGTAVKDTSLSAINAAVLMGTMVSKILKLLFLIPAMVVLFCALVCGAIVAWMMEAIRYFLLVTGAVLLPVAIACHRTKSLASAGNNYVLHMVSVCLWPVGWALGNAGTVGIFNAWVGLMSGTTTMAYWDKWSQSMTWDKVLTDGVNFKTTATAAFTGSQMFASLASMGSYQVLLFVIGGVGLFLWIVGSTMLTPVLMHKLVTAGASFYGGVSAHVGQQAGKVVESAGSAVQAIGTAAGQPGVAAVGGVMSGAGKGMGAVMSSGGGAGDFGGAVTGGAGGYQAGREQQQRPPPPKPNQPTERDLLQGILDAMRP